MKSIRPTEHPLHGFATTWEAKSFHPHSSNEDDEDDEDMDEEPMVRRSTTLAEASRDWQFDGS